MTDKIFYNFSEAKFNIQISQMPKDDEISHETLIV